MSFTGDLLAGVAQYLEDGGVGVWQPSGAYPANTDRAIFLGQVPGSPDRIIVLSAYVVDDAPALSDSTVGLQVRTRGAAGHGNGAAELDDAAFDRLQGARFDVVGGRVTQALRRSGAPLGLDGNRRDERSSNYYLTVWRPSAHRL